MIAASLRKHVGGSIVCMTVYLANLELLPAAHKFALW
jgi:hypothetical protein